MRNLTLAQTALALSLTTPALVLLVVAPTGLTDALASELHGALEADLGDDAVATLLNTGTLIQIGERGSLEDLDAHRGAIDTLEELGANGRLAVSAVLFSCGTVTGLALSTTAPRLDGIDDEIAAYRARQPR